MEDQQEGSNTLHSIGREIDPTLPGDDQPDLVAALYAAAEAWLSA